MSRQGAAAFLRMSQESCESAHRTEGANRVNLNNAENSGVKEPGTSDWMEVTQDRIDRFSEATGDHQWIHQASPGGRLSRDQRLPFQGPVAHGLLILALAFEMARAASVLPGCTWIVCGYDRVRMRTPVKSGKRIRCHTSLLDPPLTGRRLPVKVRFTIEVEEEKLPALVADCLLLCIDDADKHDAGTWEEPAAAVHR